MELGSCTSFGAPDLDFRPSELTRSATMGVMVCGKCGYAAESLAYKTESYPSGEVDRAFQSVPESSHDNRRPYVAKAALIAEADGDFPYARRLWLKCAWEGDDTGDEVLSDYCRNRYVSLVEKHPDLTVDEQVQLLDVLRRARRFDEATERATRLISRDLDKSLQDVAIFGKSKAEEGDAKCYKMDDVRN